MSQHRTSYFKGRRRCRECDLYFSSREGAGTVCLPCLKAHWDDGDFDPWAYHQPIPIPPTNLEISLSRELTRAKQALYFLYDILEKAKGPMLPDRGGLDRAMNWFQQQYPEF